MNQLAPIQTPSVPALPPAIEQALIGGDLSKLNAEQRLNLYHAVCSSVGLNPLTQPFEYVVLNGKTKLYARKDCTDQLRKVYGVSVKIVAREKEDDIYTVTTRATLPNGREDESIGAISLKGLSGLDLANARMKAETKAKRRVTLSICGMGFLDESEVAERSAGPRSIEAVEKAARVEEIAKAPEAEVVKMAPGDYVVPLGEWADKKLSEVPVSALADYCTGRREWERENKKSIGGKLKEFLEHADAYLAEQAK